jgi:Xaa-Pro aminopeptidase
MNYVAQRRVHLLKTLKDDGVDSYLITNPINVLYLTEFTGDSSYLIVTPKHTILVSDSRFEEQIAEECPGLDVHIRPHHKTITEAAAEVLQKVGGKIVGVESAHLTLAAFEALKDKAPKLKFVPAPNRVEQLRAIKDPAELEIIREAVRVAERGFQMFTALLRGSDSEKEMADALEGFVRRAGGRCTSFSPIVAVGERSALPHAPPTSRLLSEGSKLLIDWGADLLYKSDITRTVMSPYGATPTRRNKYERSGYDFEKLYSIVEQAQAAAVAKLQHGVPAKEVDAAARKVITDAGYGKFFTHGLGHGIGLDIHELPRIRANSDDILQAGMVVTIEPGIYLGERKDPKTGEKLPGWGGIRIEDDYLITKDGAKQLTTLPHDPCAIR